jgi:SAM-dependent methyltransferase
VGGGQGLTGPASATPPPGGRAPRRPHWFEPVADHLGAAYLRYSFTKGTEQEVGFLVDVLDLGPGSRLLDVGCGPGRHSHAFARRGVRAVGVDLAARFTTLARADAPDGAAFARADARSLPVAPGRFDAAISLCQGAFGLLGGPGSGLDEDASVLDEMAAALRPGGTLAVSAFSAYFQVRYLEDGDRFDAERGVNHETTEVRDEQGRPAPAELWTSCFTPRELRLLAERAGLTVRCIWSVTPGAYGRNPPDLDHPEFLLVAVRA